MLDSIHLDPHDHRPQFMQLRDAIAAGILDGRLPPGTRLMPSRALAAALRVARKTVLDAYAELRADHLIVGDGRRGTFVAVHGAESSSFNPGWFPARMGARWVYESGEHTGVIEITGDDTALWFGAKARLEDTPGGIIILVKRPSGFAGRIRYVPLAYLRWSGPCSWSTQTTFGCSVHDVQCERGEAEHVITKVGAFDAIPIVNRTRSRTETWWLAQGIGIVQIEAPYRCWKLVEVSIPRA